MKKLRHTKKNFNASLERLYQRRAYPTEIEDGVKRILFDVQMNGDRAVRRYMKLYDGASLPPSRFRVSDEELKKASRALDRDAKDAIKQALANVMKFAAKRIPTPWTFTPRPGVIVGERFVPLDRVAVYVPGGTAPLVSTAVHTAGVAKAAGVREIVAITPPNQKGEVHPATLYALRKSGATEIYRLGGVYGVAAVAYGTETVRKVEKIVGPGNAYVTAAKKLVYGQVAIDMVAGPSEIMIIADGGCDPSHIAADMLSQAEHGSGLEQAVLVTPSSELIDSVADALKGRAAKLGRKSTVNAVLKNGVFLIQSANLEQAAEIASSYAPEHLEILCHQAGNIAKKVTAAGAVFLGAWTPEPVGDFVAGPSHVLPTGGSARFFSGLSVDQFYRRMSVVNYQKSALARELPHIQKFAELEGLDAHGLSASIRMEG